MKLIADSGSTKTDWLVLDDVGCVAATCTTQGLNPFHQCEEDILSTLREELCLSIDVLLERRGLDSLETADMEVYFYGSGVTEAMKPKMDMLLRKAFPMATTCSESDLLGAARALFGHEAGVACILGTGSNSCVYDGEKILSNTPSLGYILGDEGGGAMIGKLFLKALLRGHFAEEVKRQFFAWSGLSYEGIINKVYCQPMVNRYLASIAPFIGRMAEKARNADDKNQEFVDAMDVFQVVFDSFELFYETNLTPYLRQPMVEETLFCEKDMPIGFVGSIAYYFSDVVREVFVNRHGLKVKGIMKSPMEGLVRYHT